ncbi:hypothetical protein BJ508DRAFT_312323 [Ascobolus immersus RN42]|uniref:Uncharacterized protein n=1 Tax=Ascobolus immersus RN42 TaxID=1160509 RepID=A0A3N4HSK0_ASCIM|nr:hypothetical protein BJ508DRAFT_312323 [Ascobolus immersus RN42]
MALGFFTSRPSTRKSSTSISKKEEWVYFVDAERSHDIPYEEPPTQPTLGGEQWLVETDLDFEVDVEAENGAPFRTDADRAAREAKRRDLLQRRKSYTRRLSSASTEKKKLEEVEEVKEFEPEGDRGGWRMGWGREFGRLVLGMLSEIAFVVVSDKRL